MIVHVSVSGLPHWRLIPKSFTLSSIWRRGSNKIKIYFRLYSIEAGRRKIFFAVLCNIVWYLCIDLIKNIGRVWKLIVLISWNLQMFVKPSWKFKFRTFTQHVSSGRTGVGTHPSYLKNLMHPIEWVDLLSFTGYVSCLRATILVLNRKT